MGDPTVPITFAHRGARADEPENTLTAFRRALERGAAGLETDAWLSADGEVVLVHDSVLRRGLRRVRVSRTRAERLADLGVPRLSDLYGALGAEYELSIDVKDRAAAAPVVAAAKSAGAPERLWLCHPSLTFLSGLRDEVGSEVHLVHSRSRRHLAQPLERHASRLARDGVAAMNLHHAEWSAGLVALFQRFGVLAFAWDVQEVRHLRRVLELGIDALYCDHVDRMVSTVTAWQAGHDAAGNERRER